MRLRCPYCGKNWNASDEAVGSEAQCPECGGRVAVRATTADRFSKACPECSALMDAKAVVCVKCGYNLKTGRKLTTERRPPDRHADTGAPLDLRVMFVSVAGVGAGVAVVAHVGYRAIDQFGMLLALGFFGVLLLILGTFTRVTVSADEQGKWWIKRRSFICFVPLKEARHDPAAYDALYISYRKLFGGVGWLGTAALLVFGLLGGWLVFVHGGRSERVKLTLGRDILLYSGSDDNAMRQIIALIQEVTDLRCQRAGD